MILILNSNFVESQNSQLRDFLTIGKFTDFSQEWYTVVGPVLIYSAMMNAIIPVGTMAITFSIWWVKKALDRSCSADRLKTKKKTV
jgi:hypothetical protein